MATLSHFDDSGGSRMVDVSDKGISARYARATARVVMSEATRKLICDQRAAKGNVLEVARLAGIMASKRTSELIPLCHALALEAVEIGFCFPDQRTVVIEAQVRVEAKTGVEMEALTAVSVAALTIYDMCKGIERGIVIQQVQLEEKSGGRSGHYVR